MIERREVTGDSGVRASCRLPSVQPFPKAYSARTPFELFVSSSSLR